MTRITLLALAGSLLLLLGCPKRTPAGVSGSDEEKLDQFSAQLEELRSRVQAKEPKCEEWCSLSRQVCDISRQVCQLASRQVDRPEVQKRCSGSQEDCAHFNDSCTACR